MKVSKSSSGILSSGGNVVASDLTVDGSTVTVDESNNRLGVNTDEPLGTLGIDGDLFFQPVTGGITTSHVYTNGSLDIRCTDNMKIGTDGADSVKIGRTNSTAAKVHISSGTESDLVVSNSMVGIGTDTPTQALELDGNIQLSPSAISTAHIFTTGSLDVRASANIKIGTDGADSVKIGRTNSGLVKCHVRSGGENDLVVSNSMVGIGTDTPDHTLSVAGDIDLTGALSFDGSAVAITEIDTDISSVAGTDTTLATAKAIKTYVDSVAGGSTDLTSDVTGTLPVANGGTGATSLTDGGILLGSGTSAVTATAVLANGELLIGDNSGDPTVATLTGGSDITVTNGAGSISIAVDNLATSKITSGTFDDARIAASNVTQHQASITSTGALNSGSITSGFGNIDIGSSTIDTTGAVGTGTITAAGDITATGGDLTLGTAADSADTTIKAADESGTDTAGKKRSIQGGLGTGNAAPGAVEISVGVPAAGSGSGVQSASLAIKATAEGPSTYYGGTASLANDSGVGEIVIFGTEDTTDTLAAGKLMYLASDGKWKHATGASTEAEASSMLAIALGTAVSDGLLVKGYFKLNSYKDGTFAKGAPCFVSDTDAKIDFTKLSSAGQHVRVVGYGTDTTDVIMFDPSGTWITL